MDSLEDELRAHLNMIIALAMDAQIMLTNRQYPTLNNQLTRIERTAREASYCIFDIADMM